MGTLFSEDFSGISAGANISEDSNWIIHSAGSATAKEASGKGRLETIAATNPSRVTIEPVMADVDEKSELFVTFSKGPTGLAFFDYDYIYVGSRVNYFSTAGTEPSPWNSNYPHRGWYWFLLPWRDPKVQLLRSNGGGAGTSIVAATDIGVPGWTTSTTFHAKFQWQKSGSDWVHRCKVWTGDPVSDEPGSWEIEYTDTAPGSADDPAGGKWAISQNHGLGTTANQNIDLDNIVIDDMLVAVPETSASLSATLAITGKPEPLPAPTSAGIAATFDVDGDADIGPVTATLGITGNPSANRVAASSIAASTEITGVPEEAPPETSAAIGASLDVDGQGSVARVTSASLTVEAAVDGIATARRVTSSAIGATFSTVGGVSTDRYTSSAIGASMDVDGAATVRRVTACLLSGSMQIEGDTVTFITAAIVATLDIDGNAGATRLTQTQITSTLAVTGDPESESFASLLISSDGADITLTADETAILMLP